MYVHLKIKRYFLEFTEIDYYYDNTFVLVTLAYGDKARLLPNLCIIYISLAKMSVFFIRF